MQLYTAVLPDDNVVHITILLLRELRVKVTRTTIRDTLLSNPHHPSLLSVADSLRQWQIDSLAIKTHIDKLPDIPCPFIVHIDFDPGSFIIITNTRSATVTYLTDQDEQLQMPIDELANRWNGQVLIPEKKQDSGEKDFPLQQRKEYWSNHRIFWGIAILFLLGLLPLMGVIGHPVKEIVFISGSYLVNCAGISVTAHLLWYEYDLENPFVRKFCAVSATADCASVIFSKGGKLFSLISWSEIGFIYFAGAFFYQVFAINNFYWLAFISLPAAVYIIYSLAYQYFVIKKWCLLCLAVQALLLIQLLLGILTEQVTQAFIKPGNVWNSSIPFCYAIPIVCWFVLKPYLYEAREKKLLEKQLAKIKSSRHIFDQLLQLQIPMKTHPGPIGITIGDPKASNVIVKVCSPYCEPCASSHPDLDQLLDNKNYQAQVIFTTGAKKDDRDSQAAAYLLNKAAAGSARNILAEWYSSAFRNADLPVSKEQAENKVAQHAAHLQAMYNWCVQEKIEITPTIYVNGRRLPGQYTIHDLIHMHDE